MKLNTPLIAGSLLLGTILVGSLYGLSNSLASGRYDRDHDWYEYGRDYDDRRRAYGYRGDESARPGAADAAEHYQLYRDECGACHMAYPPQLLPRPSWQAVMDGLADHFGDNAELDPESTQKIAAFLQHWSPPSRYGRMMRNLGDKAPLRITELPHFRHEHDEIPTAFLRDNDKVTSLSQCNACHQQAERGWFDEDSVFIPGIGRWDD